MKIVILATALLFGQNQAQTLVIRSVKYVNFKGIPAEDAANRLKSRGVRVAVEQMYEPEQVDSARAVLNELLEEKGRHGFEVKSAVRQVPPRSVEVTFTAVQK